MGKMKRSDTGASPQQILAKALAEGRRTLNEFESKRLLSSLSIPVTEEWLVHTVEEAVNRAKRIGYPVALKACGADLAHKTERGAISLNLRGAREVKQEGIRLQKIQGCEGLLIQEMVAGERELAVGLTRDPTFGPCLMFGLGGTLAEVIKDVTFRTAPLNLRDALEMIMDIRGKEILGHFRNQAPVDLDELARILVALGEIAISHEEIFQIDVNPLKIRPDGRPVAVDALVVLSPGSLGQLTVPETPELAFPRSRSLKLKDDWARFFEPASVAVIGASSVPGKPGYEVIRNILANDYPGKIYLVNPRGGEIQGLKVYQSVFDLPDGIDLGVIIVPAEKCSQALRECASKGIKHLVMAAGGFAEVDDNGAQIQSDLMMVIQEHGLHVLGPNTSGNISTPAKFTSTFFPLGRIRRGNVSYIAQTGNFATHTMKYVLSAENFGVARVIGLGNAIDTDECDALEYLEGDPETKAILIYLENIKRPRRFLEIARRITPKKPIVMLKGGASDAGKQAAIAHTASMALEDHLVDGLLKQAGIVRIHDYTHLILAGKALSMCPLPKGNRISFLAPSGAMLVVLSDLCTRLGLEVPSLQPENVKKLQDISPPFIFMRNPVDIWAAASTRGIEFGYSQGMQAVLSDPNIDAVIPVLLLTKDTGIPSYDFIVELANRYPDKPLLVTFSGEEYYMRECKAYLEPKGVPTFTEIEAPFRVLSILLRCKRMMDRGSP
jgi:acyl-CoA synthetase (NDP forming)